MRAVGGYSEDGFAWRIVVAATAASLMFTAVLSMILITWFASVGSWQHTLLDPEEHCPLAWEYPRSTVIGMPIGGLIGAVGCGALLVALRRSARQRRRAWLLGSLVAAVGAICGPAPVYLLGPVGESLSGSP